MTARGSPSRQTDESIASFSASSSVVVRGGETTSGLVVAAHVMCDRGASAPAMNHESSQIHSARSIRQIDADILEQGVEERWGAAVADFDDEGRRLLASESSASLVDLDDDPAAREFGACIRDGPGMVGPVGESSIDLSPSSSTYLGPYPRTARACAMTASSSYDNSSLPAITELASCRVPHQAADGSRTQTRTQNVVESFTPPNDLSENFDYFLDTDSPTSPSKPIQEIDHEALLRRISSGRAHNRSESFDRRMNESAQFAEAVGEEPDSLMLQKIVEDDSSSDFDDNEIDEEDANLMLDEDDQVQLMDYEAVTDGTLPGGGSVAEEEVRGSTSDKIEPTCVSIDVTKMSLKEEESPHQELPLLPATLEVEIACSTPTTPAPSPCIPNAHRRSLTSSAPLKVNWTFTRQFSSGLNLERNKSFPSNEADFVYRGIRANPPEITKKGVARGNYAQMHRKAWLEVSDKRHRYGKNLRMYYKHWEELGHPFHMFFDWLDSKGEATGNPLPSLSEIPRPVLDSDTVFYITDPEITASYVLDIVANPADGSATILDQNGNPVSTGKEGWIFVLRDNVFYGSQKVTAPKSLASGGASNGSLSTGEVIPRQRFHHSTFFGGKAVASAGIFLTDERGLLTQLWPHSGHYRPGEAHMQRVLFFLQELGVDLSTFVVDMQQIFKVTRELSHKGGNTTRRDNGKGDDDKDNDNHTAMKNGKVSNETHARKAKKIAKVGCLHLLSGQEVALFLAHKALMIEKGVFQQIHKIRRIPKESRDCVHFVLNHVNT